MKRGLMEGKAIADKTDGGGMRFKAEAFDVVQFILDKFRINDHQVHFAISFDGRLNENVLREAVLLTLEAVPILGCRFVEDGRHPYWQRLDSADHEKAFSLIESCNPADDLGRLLVSRTAALEGPQVHVTLLRGPRHDVLNVVINHMISDAAGFKQYVYLLASAYSGLMEGPHYRPASGDGGSRSLSQVFDRFNLPDKLRLLRLPGNMQDGGYVLQNGWHGEDELRPYVQLSRLEQPGYSALREYCRHEHFTVNDVILAAYYRTLYRLLQIKRDVPLNVSCTVDLRRYLPGKKARAICNLSSYILCDIIPGEAESFDDTARRVHEVMEARKKNFPGLGGMLKMHLALESLRYDTIKKGVRGNLHFPPFGMTNLDRIDKNLLAFGGTPVTDAFMTGSTKYPPYFHMGFSTFNDAITFSLNLWDREMIDNFFALFNQELMEGIGAAGTAS